MAAALRVAVLAAGLVLCTWLPARGAPGDLDPSFGTGGKAQVSFGTSDMAFGTVLQGDGKIVVAGAAYGGSFYDFGVARLAADGSLDASFGSGGQVTVPFAAMGDYAQAVALEDDGRIVLAGVASTAGADQFALTRLLPDGALDTTFNGTGKVTTSFLAVSYAWAVAVQDDGKIVAGGAAGGMLTPPLFALARYNPDGTLDTTFNGTGKVTTDVAGGGGLVTSVLLQEDGKIVATGFAGTGSTEGFAVVRYDANGTLDTTFNGTGKVVTTFGPHSRGLAAALEPDGRIVVGGWTGNLDATATDFAVVRYLPSGALDPSLGGTGMVSTPVGTARDAAEALALAPDGKIILSGWVFVGSSAQLGVARFLPDGTLDTTFGGSGTRLVPVGGIDASGWSAVVQDDRKIVIAGRIFPTASEGDFLVVRLEGDPLCGNAVPEWSEACDDGNTDDGDCCSSSCAIEPAGTRCRPALDACDVPEECDGAAPSCPADLIVPDSDGDGECDAIDPCTNVGGARAFVARPKPKLLFTGVGRDTRVGNDKLLLSGAFGLPSGASFAGLAPATDGVRIVARDRLGAPVLDVALPGVAFAGRGTRGWRRSASGRSWTYSDATASPVGDVVKVVLTDRSRSVPGQVGVRVGGRNGEWAVAPGDEPLLGVIALGGTAASTAGHCGEAAFVGGQCTWNARETTIACKR